MKYITNIIRKEFKNNKKGYLFLTGIILIGIIFGSLFITILDKHDKLLITNQISSFFYGIKTDKLNYVAALTNSLLSNILLVIGIWILGISIIGIPIILFLLFMKGFIIGFSIVSIIYKYKLLGTILSFIYIFPIHIMAAIILLILSRYACKLSLNLIVSIFNKKTINFKDIITKYFRILIIAIIVMIVVALLETFIVPAIFKIFTPLIK
jgi:stage II sporulation protein M